MAKGTQNLAMEYLDGTGGVHCLSKILVDDLDYARTKNVIINDESAQTTETGTITSTGTAVVGTGTDFDGEVEVGDYLVVLNATAGKGNEARRVVSIADDTNLVIDAAYSTDVTDEAVILAVKSGQVARINIIQDRGAFIGLDKHIPGPLTTAHQIILVS